MRNTQNNKVPYRQLFGLFYLAAIPAVYILGRPVEGSFSEWNAQFFGTLFSIPMIFVSVFVLGIAFYTSKNR